MEKFVNNLRQTISFKILSILGYVSFPLYLTIESLITFVSKPSLSLVYIELLIFLFFMSICYYTILIFIIIGLFEYHKKKLIFKDLTKDSKFYLFVIGLILNMAYLILTFKYYILNPIAYMFNV